MWIARPDQKDSPALWTPPGVKPEGPPRASVFFVHPTSFLGTSHWNAPLGDSESQWRARLFVRSQASAFNGVAAIWAPKYRQATFGAFLTTKAEARQALDFAYRDVAAAFDEFLREAPSDRPIILAGHSQGSLHLTRLLAERIAGKAEAKRIVAAYVIGWPVSIPADLPSLGLPACERREQAGCVVSWQSFAEPADPKLITDVYDNSSGATGIRRAGSPMLCTNPLTGARGGEAPAAANLGTLVPNAELTEGRLQAPGVAARCDVRGFLLIGEDAPDLGPYVLPGNNYHVYDYALFWANLRADVAARMRAFSQGGHTATAHPE
jgi:pimeloyl-ACP methyl ester carboxylesterase